MSEEEGPRQPHPGTLTLYRPIRPARPGLPGGQAARDRGGTWYYRPCPPAGDDDGTLPRLLPPDLDHYLRRRGDLLSAIDDVRDRARLGELFDAHGALGTPQVIAIEDALTDAARTWRTLAPGTPQVWIVAPHALTTAAERLTNPRRPGA